MSSLSASEKPIERDPGAEEPKSDESVAAPTLYSDDAAVVVDGLDITYRVSLERKNSLKNALVRKARHEQVRYREVKAIKGVSFDVPAGKCTGFIGANGAGKSTLMRAVAGILPPTKGRIEVRGKVSTLLALGVGFNTALTGRENVLLGGMAAGLSRDQVNERFDEIAGFADLGDFIDMPLRTYSSGMRSRLAFSVSVFMNPDILIIDEALSAGDAKFKQKASQKMSELMETAGTMLLVSHALTSIQEMSDEVIWLHKGRLIRRGEPKEICDAYLEFLKVGDEAVVMEDF
ncbi:teichoic acid transport system ATP-binding protein [Tessaracoccus bendigoensis DSM 12906]|uniref:Teichoic acid transport system ATP-binding protein n=1 Tax=Tessaracoccus bendigoensis DSM 12906 TaxID=1123357 RepID=A0A1M6DI03_9ACTN|nr:ABC transporter ATP-binding protein [Tessaracoccus bendigoensis]SHI72886.1 teichoic acid transport system ATP-binding protein [Tessaracoccus bendigoensis DSM 12906]